MNFGKAIEAVKTGEKIFAIRAVYVWNAHLSMMTDIM